MYKTMPDMEPEFALFENRPGGGDALLRLLPRITRARNWRLYTAEGKRLVDLWQYGGRAVLGHNPPALLRTIKNSGEQGLFAPLPHAAEGRLYKALSLLLPRRRFRLYENEESLRGVLRAAGTGFVPVVWRPWLEPAAEGRDAPVSPDLTPPVEPAPPESAPPLEPALLVPVLLVPVLPLPFPGAPAVLALDPSLDGLFPLSPVLSPLALTAAARSVYTLLSSPERGSPRFPKVDRALQHSPVWKRRGIYLFYRPMTVADKGQENAVSEDPAAADYAGLFRRFLDGGFLLPPEQAEPAILPGELSPGEEAKLAALISAAG
ncbi:MAG: hypothetical protein LBK74_05700 [Treponema sp.]|jgi:hypothetical protein|nr:hypothetical protein [Treponema sp.]